MKYLVLVIAVSVLFSCNSKEEKETPTKEVKVVEPIIKEYGITFNDFKVVRDTIKSGDTFSKMMEQYVLPDSMNVHQLTEKVRDSFNLRAI